MDKLDLILKEEMKVKHEVPNNLNIITKEKIRIAEDKNHKKTNILLYSLCFMTYFLQMFILCIFINELIFKIIYLYFNVTLIIMLISFTIFKSKKGGINLL